MSNYEHKAGNGSLFKNPNKTAENSQPEYSGQIMTQDGKLQQIAAWMKDGTKGKYMSLRLSDPYVKKEDSFEKQKAEAVSSQSEDLPF
jgi:Tol biopolymer transport system component|tara:strand:+ start:3824 stop:4087 length:264 start_codon:yes stop_codon:yes gene_type:complete